MVKQKRVYHNDHIDDGWTWMALRRGAPYAWLKQKLLEKHHPAENIDKIIRSCGFSRGDFAKFKKNEMKSVGELNIRLKRPTKWK